MPDLNGLVLRSNPRVLATGRLIKALHYSHASTGPHDMVAFYMACERQLEPRPFLVMNFQSSRFFFDHNRDGCTDATGTLPQPEIDPADFSAAIDGMEELCYEDAISSLSREILVSSVRPLSRKF
ncbi:hypothetical protein [Microvirga sp. KLBC 81]|uniref:hypothetical protein n=1 Tax=Microvirga sp. KLBC 81 TaxID=1862707 RepID=UPI001057DA3F|nr:hypothetical protein [Microvirga sp. KLBC 81]